MVSSNHERSSITFRTNSENWFKPGPFCVVLGACIFAAYPEVFLAGLGMYFLAHNWTGNRLGAAVAGTVFAFNGLTLNSLMWPNNIAALGWMPWVVLLVEQALLGGARKRVSAIAVSAAQMLAGA